MVGIDLAYGYNDLAGLDVELAAGKGFVYPELLQRNLAATFCLCLIFAAFVGINLYGALCAAVLKLYLHAHCPSVAEVVAEVQRNVWQVEASVAGVVLVCVGVTVAVEMLTVEVAACHRLAISADRKARESFGNLRLTVIVVALALCLKIFFYLSSVFCNAGLCLVCVLNIFCQGWRCECARKET